MVHSSNDSAWVVNFFQSCFPFVDENSRPICTRTLILASHADVLRGSSGVPAQRTPAEPKDKSLSHYSQISAGDHMQIIGDPIGAV